MMLANENFTNIIAVNSFGQDHPKKAGLDILLEEREALDDTKYGKR